MGGSSTSHSAVLRERKTGGSSAFDLHSWQGLTEVLKIGKESLADPHAYAEFRNLVLSYAQQGGDAAIRKQIDDIIATFGATTEAPIPEEPKDTAPAAEKKVEPEPVAVSRGGVGTRRLEPQFKKSTLDARSPEPVPAPPVQVVKEAPAPHNLPVEPEPQPEPVAEVEVVPAAPLSTPPPPKKEVIVPPAPPSGFRTLEEHKARIAEIKRMVNARVGNPAMLIDTHNNEGKEYMKALLAALKATGGGGSPNVDASMDALETATARILEHGGDEKEETPAPSAPAVEAEPTIPPSRAVPAERIVEAPEEKSEPLPAALPPEPLPVERQTQTEVMQEADSKIFSVMKDMQKTKESSPNDFTSFLIKDAPTPPRAEPRVVPLSKTSGEKVSVSPPGPVSAGHTIREVPKRPLEDIKKEHGVDATTIVTKQTELSSPEITESLHQLLDEWSIFQGKGFFGFGMGPSGQEHPLYQTLAPLSMGEVIAGRWEGSDPKLKKTIKQYVDAWRHEQGIAYVITETFEHYLRRVVQRILKGQKSI